ncbi:cytochrome c/c1 heme lyase-domain-containing protein [Boletus edulis]|uniref:Holocytochrome c-type synthase n=1 Tax=Boletus edulis BED1 TaxID=1328754 RepID=A0AAD4BJR9_BOLED|nr:cytochrome c/c1 heme lyase-domain-containing protein [Boletus edulis]KAF8432475.1 cytochrome c/c1 heme lyase-domain-containing protein [Boletus edulis BED1]
MTDKCPVDHGRDSGDSCPVGPSARSTWSSLFSTKGLPQLHQSSLSTEREVSSIPRASDASNWVYPSEVQFFAAMARKNHNPQTSDMKTIVPIHNAVNERAWSEVLKWEAGRGGDECGGVRLVNFKGRPNDMSPKARLMTFFGYSAPFDRHDWIVDRCGTKIRYVIDFYTGRATGSSSVSFYLDVRPALDDWDGVKMRLESAFSGLFGPKARESGIASPS